MITAMTSKYSLLKTLLSISIIGLFIISIMMTLLLIWLLFLDNEFKSTLDTIQTICLIALSGIVIVKLASSYKKPQPVKLKIR